MAVPRQDNLKQKGMIFYHFWSKREGGLNMLKTLEDQIGKPAAAIIPNKERRKTKGFSPGKRYTHEGET